MAQSPTLDPSTLSPTASTGAILQAGVNENKRETERKEQEERTRRQKETERLEGRVDDRNAELDRRYALEQERLWQDKQEARKDRALSRQLTAEGNVMQMQLEYSRLAQADKQRAQDRKDKALMMLLQGLGNLGTAFTI